MHLLLKTWGPKAESQEQPPGPRTMSTKSVVVLLLLLIAAAVVVAGLL